MLLTEFGFNEQTGRSVTVAQFLMRWERWVDREDRENYRTAVIAAIVANSSAKRKRKALLPRDIIPSLRERMKEKQINTPEDQVAALKLLYGNIFETEKIPEE